MRFKRAFGHTAHDRFVAVSCDAGSHDEWGVVEFVWSGRAWVPSSEITLRDGRVMRQRGDEERDPIQLVTADGEFLPEPPPLPDEDEDGEFDEVAFEAMRSDPERQRALARRHEPDVHARYAVRCPRCGDSLVVRMARLDVALDLLDRAEQHFVTLTTLRRAVAAVGRQ